MADVRDTASSENPACVCGHPLLRHVFGNGWCTHTEAVANGHHGCTCHSYDGPRPAPHPVDTTIVHDQEGRAVLAYVPR